MTHQSLSRRSRARARPAEPPSALYPHAGETPAAAWRTPAEHSAGNSLHLPRAINWPAVGVLLALAAFWCAVGALIGWLV